MKFLLIPILLIACAVAAQPAISKGGVYKNGKLIRLENLMLNNRDECNPAPAIYIGQVTKTIYSSNGSSDILGFVIEGKNGTRTSLYFLPGVESDLSNADASWLKKLVIKGTRLKVITFACGNAGIPNVDTIIPLN